MSCFLRLLASLLQLFLYRCKKCSGNGKIPCATCGSRGLIKCKKCNGSGALLSCNVAIVRWYVYEFLLIFSLPVRLWCWWNFPTAELSRLCLKRRLTSSKLVTVLCFIHQQVMLKKKELSSAVPTELLSLFYFKDK